MPVYIGLYIDIDIDMLDCSGPNPKGTWFGSDSLEKLGAWQSFGCKKRVWQNYAYNMVSTKLNWYLKEALRGKVMIQSASNVMIRGTSKSQLC